MVIRSALYVERALEGGFHVVGEARSVEVGCMMNSLVVLLQRDELLCDDHEERHEVEPDCRGLEGGPEACCG